MAFIEPVTLKGAIATLEPLAREHEAGLAKAAADGELWQLWYTSVAPPDKMAEYIATALDMRELDAMPFVVRDNATGDVVGCTRYFNVDVANRRLEIGHTWYAKRVQRRRSTPSASSCCSPTRSRRCAASPSNSARTGSITRRARLSPGWARSRTACCAITS